MLSSLPPPPSLPPAPEDDDRPGDVARCRSGTPLLPPSSSSLLRAGRLAASACLPSASFHPSASLPSAFFHPSACSPHYFWPGGCEGGECLPRAPSPAPLAVVSGALLIPHTHLFLLRFHISPPPAFVRSLHANPNLPLVAPSPPSGRGVETQPRTAIEEVPSTSRGMLAPGVKGKSCRHNLFSFSSEPTSCRDLPGSLNKREIIT